MQKGLNFLLEKYSAGQEAVLSADGKSVVVDGQTVPLLPWESERRISELRNIFLSGRIGNICTCRIGHTTQAGGDLSALLAREIGILEYVTDSAVREIFAVSGSRTMNCIAETTSGCVCTIELGATLRPGESDIDKHEIIADRGVACDRAADTQIPQQSVYVFGRSEGAWLDTDAELYGYTEGQCGCIRNAFAAVRDARVRTYNRQKSAHIRKVVESAEKSLELTESVPVDNLS